MKPIALALILAALVGCSGDSSAGANATAAKDPFLQKLQSLPESERAEYARKHAAEAMASAGSKPPATSGQ